MSERNLAVADVGEGRRVKCELEKGPDSHECQRRTPGRAWTPGKTRGFLLRPAMGQLACRVCCSLVTLPMQWDTCQDLDEGQNLTTTHIISFIYIMSSNYNPSGGLLSTDTLRLYTMKENPIQPPEWGTLQLMKEPFYGCGLYGKRLNQLLAFQS